MRDVKLNGYCAIFQSPDSKIVSGGKLLSISGVAGGWRREPA